MPAAFTRRVGMMTKPNHSHGAEPPGNNGDKPDLPGIGGNGRFNDFRHPETDEVIGDDYTEVNEAKPPDLRTFECIHHAMLRFRMAAFECFLPRQGTQDYIAFLR